MIKFSLKKTAAVLSVFIFTLSGCSKAKEATSDSSITGLGISIDTENDKEDVMTMSMCIAKTLNPLVNSDKTVDRVLSLMYEKLINIGSDGKATPNIAESWTFNNDGSVAYINIKNNICFSDGTRLTAYDVAYSLKTIDNADNSYYKSCVDNIKTWTVTGDYTISVTFKGSTGRNIYYLAIPIISRAFYGGDYAKEDVNSDTALGNGLYRFESFERPDSLTMIASLNCFKGMAGVNKIKVIMTKDEDTNLNLFSQGITDIYSADKAETVKTGAASGVRSVSYTTGEYDFIGFNFNNKILSDRNVRQAIAYAVDKKGIIEGIYLNNAEEAYSPVSSSSWLYDSSVYGYGYDLSVAKMLLEQSGWRYRTGDENVRQDNSSSPSKLSLRLLVNGENNERKQVGVKLAETLRGLGFEINIETVNFNTFKERLQSGNYDVFIGGWNLSAISDFTFMFGSAELNGDEGNLINYSSAKMDEYLKACKSAIDDESMQTAYSTLQKYISQELPYISLVFRQANVYMSQRLEGEPAPVRDNVLNGIENITIKK